MYADAEYLACSGGNNILSFRGGLPQSSWAVRFPLQALGAGKAFLSLSRRFFRWGVYHFRPLGGESWVAMAFGRIYRGNWAEGSIENCGRIVGTRPLTMCHRPDNGHLYYGEYWGDRRSGPVHIFGSDDQGRSWNPVYCLEGVRHIHGVYYDPYTGAVWVTTGDQDEESALWNSDDHFRSLHKIVGGSQDTRAVQLLFTENFVYFASDSPHERNHICRLDRKSGRIEKLQEVESSVFYGTKVGERLFFSTIAEPSPVNETEKVVIWGSMEGENWKPFTEFKKDPWPHKLFQYGQVMFPAGPGDGRHLWLTPYSCRGDQVSLCYDLQDEKE